MQSTMDVRSRSRSSKTNRRRGRETASGDGVDRISNLADDLLVRILELLPDTRDAVRTHALSRRWLGLWTGVPALRFDLKHTPPAVYSWEAAASAAERYIAFVDNTLAFRAAAQAQPTTPAVKDLAISLVNIYHLPHETAGRLVAASVAAAKGWIRYAAQQEVKSFVLELMLPRDHVNDDDTDQQHPVIALDEADIGAKMESLRLELGSVQLRLPSSPTVAFASLTHLSLESIKLPAGGGHLLSRLVSSACCPHLHVLQLACIDLSTMEMEGWLIIESDALLELSLEAMYELRFLEIRTPILRVLRMEDCLDLDGFTVSAPKLEDLMVSIQQPLEISDVHGDLSRVGTLKIQLFSHGDDLGDDDEINDSSIHLLQYCTLTKHFEVSFHVEQFYRIKEQRNDIITGRIPQLPHVTSLAVHVELPERHLSGPGVGYLLAQCSNVKYLSLHLCYYTSIKQKDHSELDLLCDNNSCHWKSHKFSLAHLKEVEFKNLIGTNCEFQFIQSTLARATKIQKVTISFDPCWQKDNNIAFELMPPIDGSWTNCDDANLSFMWRRTLLSMSED